MDENDFKQNPYAAYSKFIPREFKDLKTKPHPLAGFRFSETGRMQDPLMAIKTNQEVMSVETTPTAEIQNAAVTLSDIKPADEPPAAKKQTGKRRHRDKPLWPEIVKLLRQHPGGLDSDDIVQALGEKRQAVVSALGKARQHNPASLSLVDGRWVLKRVPEGMQDDPWEVSAAVGRIFTPPEPALPEFDQAEEFVAAVREIARRVIGTDERLALLLQTGAEWVDQAAGKAREA